jgi:hypothetical protein
MFLQGVPLDEFDVEWDEGIRADFGTRGAGMLREAVVQVDAGLQTAELVQHAFHEYDRLLEAAAEIYRDNEESRNSDCGHQENSDLDAEEDLLREGNNILLNPVSMHETLENSELTPLFAGS